MKKNKLKIYLQFGILIFGISLLLTNCQKDDEQFQTSENIKANTNIKISTLNKTEIEKDKRLINKIGKLQTDIKAKGNSSSNNRDVYNSEYDFTINTDYAKHIDNGINHTYTFPIYREQNNGLLENLLLVEQDNDSFKAYIVQYEFTEAEMTAINFRQTVDMKNKVTFIEINDNGLSNDIFGKYYYNGSCYEDNYVYQQGSSCLSGQHTFSQGNECDYWGTINMATTGGYVLTPTLVSCDGGGGSSNTGNTNPPSGDTNDNPHGGSTSTSTTTPITCRTCPVLEDDIDVGQRECKKVKELLEDNPSYKQALITLAGTVNQQVENGIFLDDNSSNVQTIPQGSAGKLNINMNPLNDYLSIAHTHDASGTYSVFSWDDLTTIANLVRTGKIKTSKFVAFLITEKGTRYAFTINSSSKFLDFFYNPANLPQGTPVDVSKLLKMQKAFEDYYKKDNPKAKIKTTNTNNDEVQKAFLQMIRDNKIGLDVFEVDANFDVVDKLKLESDNTTVTPENCN